MPRLTNEQLIALGLDRSALDRRLNNRFRANCIASVAQRLGTHVASYLLELFEKGNSHRHLTRYERDVILSFGLHHDNMCTA